MKIRVYPSHYDEYNSIDIFTEDLPIHSNHFHVEELPCIYIDDLISALIDKN